MTFAPHQGDDSPAPPSHRLHRLELEISTSDEPLARSVMDRLSRLHHDALESLLERVFSELSPPRPLGPAGMSGAGSGHIQANDLEQQLAQRLEAVLRRALASRLPPPLPPSTTPLLQLPLLQPPAAPSRPQPQSATDPPAAPTAAALPTADADGHQRQLELLAVFTATGTLPWWAPRHVRQLIAAALDTALALPPHELRALLRHWPARQEPHRRPCAKNSCSAPDCCRPAPAPGCCRWSAVPAMSCWMGCPGAGAGSGCPGWTICCRWCGEGGWQGLAVATFS